MEPKAKNLRETTERLAREAKTAAEALTRYEQTCNHKYSPIVYDPIRHDSYTIPGDPPGTMGVDWRGPTYVPAETIPRWRRECELCGKVEYTQRTRDEVNKFPVF